MAYYIVEVWTAQEPAKKAHFLSPTVWEARKSYAEKHGYDVTDVMGRRLG